jgi:hypothetical protein
MSSIVNGRKPDRYVQGFGGTTHAIYQPVGTPKPREECEPFTFTLAKPEGYRAAESVKAQEKFVKGLNSLLAKQAREEAKRAKAAAKLAKAAK